MAVFQKAEKKQAKLRLAFTGPSGSGKTFSALLVARGLGGKIAFIDTENHSASLYAGEAGIPDFDTLEIDPPYTIGKYVEAIKAAVSGGYGVLVIDSISHAWAGEGGLLDKKQAIDARGGNSYTNWATITKEQEQFKAMLLNCDIHLITTMRSKQDYVIETNERGKAAPRKIGLAPIQRDGMEYEFTMVLDMAIDHSATISKTRVRSFDGQVFRPSAKTGADLLVWLTQGKAPEPVAPKMDAKEEISQRLSRYDMSAANLILKKLTAYKNGHGEDAFIDYNSIAGLTDAFAERVVEKLREAKIGE